MITKIQACIDPALLIHLTDHRFKSSLTQNDIYEIGKRYINIRFIRKDHHGYTLPFVTTIDGIPVEFDSGNTAHFLSKKDEATGYRNVNGARIRRLHWIIPILTGKIGLETLVYDDGDKRRYYIKNLEYLIVLNHRPDGRLRLNTAYKITEAWEKSRIKKLFKVQ